MGAGLAIGLGLFVLVALVVMGVIEIPGSKSDTDSSNAGEKSVEEIAQEKADREEAERKAREEAERKAREEAERIRIISAADPLDAENPDSVKAVAQQVADAGLDTGTAHETILTALYNNIMDGASPSEARVHALMEGVDAGLVDAKIKMATDKLAADKRAKDAADAIEMQRIAAEQAAEAARIAAAEAAEAARIAAERMSAARIKLREDILAGVPELYAKTNASGSGLSDLAIMNAIDDARQEIARQTEEVQVVANGVKAGVIITADQVTLRPAASDKGVGFKTAAIALAKQRAPNKSDQYILTAVNSAFTIWINTRVNQKWKPRSGYEFGGMYSGAYNNPSTGAKSCPPGFSSVEARPTRSGIDYSVNYCYKKYVNAPSAGAMRFGGMRSKNWPAAAANMTLESEAPSCGGYGAHTILGTDNVDYNVTLCADKLPIGNVNLAFSTKDRGPYEFGGMSSYERSNTMPKVGNLTRSSHKIAGASGVDYPLYYYVDK